MSTVKWADRQLEVTPATSQIASPPVAPAVGITSTRHHQRVADAAPRGADAKGIVSTRIRHTSVSEKMPAVTAALSETKVRSTAAAGGRSGGILSRFCTNCGSVVGSSACAALCSLFKADKPEEKKPTKTKAVAAVVPSVAKGQSTKSTKTLAANKPAATKKTKKPTTAATASSTKKSSRKDAAATSSSPSSASSSAATTVLAGIAKRTQKQQLAKQQVISSRRAITKGITAEELKNSYWTHELREYLQRANIPFASASASKAELCSRVLSVLHQGAAAVRESLARMAERRAVRRRNERKGAFAAVTVARKNAKKAPASDTKKKSA